MRREDRGMGKKGVELLFSRPPEHKVEERTGESEKKVSKEIGGEFRDIALAVLKAVRSPRVAIHSPFITAVMNLLKIRDPTFSISAELREMLEDAIRRKYPEESRVIERALTKLENQRRPKISEEDLEEMERLLRSVGH